MTPAERAEIEEGMRCELCARVRNDVHPPDEGEGARLCVACRKALAEAEGEATCGRPW